MLVATVLGLALGGCNAVGFATQPDRPDGGPVCDDVKIGESGVRVLTCAEAVAAAEASLGLHWAITSATFNRGDDGTRDPDHVMCAPSGCPGLRVGSVRFEFSTGDPVVIYITLDDEDVPVVSNS